MLLIFNTKRILKNKIEQRRNSLLKKTLSALKGNFR